MALSKDEQKILAANTAIDTLIKEGKIFSGMKIGLGTGSTALPAVKRLSERIEDGTLHDIKAVVTSFQTENYCKDLEIPVYTLNDRAIGGELDLAIDGADEIDPKNNLIKGGGAALLLEKIVAYNSKNYAIVADESKSVENMGTRFPLFLSKKRSKNWAQSASCARESKNAGLSSLITEIKSSTAHGKAP